ncbi:putative Endo-beta-1,4-glucanase D [Seiridium unicorne]|uniref:lytic cellulose monooxygenase (C4-dehydrogenating) n=1 Tax=Seiridium unicorne TaxID=138068 RepID=A0ABR2UFC6_9PEZI
MQLNHLPLLALFATTVSAHGYVQQILFGDSLVDTWNPYKDPQKNVNKITRKFLDNGPVTDGYFTTDAITCNYGAEDQPNNVPVNITAEVAAGDKLTLYWTDWESDHPGPRHEILGLQRTNTNGSLAQFYPSCNQITITGSGTTQLPTGIALPGAYQPDDTTSIFLEYRDISADNPYTAPGGQVWGDDGWSDQQNMAGI